MAAAKVVAEPVPNPAAAAEDKGAGASGKASLMPAIIAIVLSPVLTWAVAQFVLLPKLKESLHGGAAESAEHADAGHAAPAAAGHGGGGHGAPKGADASAAGGYRMENVVVNLAGTMGTRYLKASFLVTGRDPTLISRFDAMRPQIGDVTLAVMSSLTLADLEEPGSKNIIRERLVDAYNQVLGSRVAENLYFSEFVVQ